MGMRRRSLMNVVKTSATSNITIENVKGSWGESSQILSGYQVYESKGSHNINSGYDLAKVTFSGYPEFTFLYGSYAESSYDYMIISPLDYASAQNWTGSSSSGYLLSTSGRQSNFAPNLSYTFSNDGGEHFFYILYRKDSSVNSGSDKGYIAFRLSDYLEVDIDTFTINHRSLSKTISINSDQNWQIYTNDNWIHLSEDEGSGFKIVNITFDANLNNSNRHGIVSINSNIKLIDISIEQSAYDIIVTDSLTIEEELINNINITSELELSMTYESDWFSCQLSNEGNEYVLSIQMISSSDEPLESVITLYSGMVTREIKILYVPLLPLFYFPLTSSSEVIQGLTPYAENDVTFSDEGVYISSDYSDLIYNSEQFDNVRSVFVEVLFTQTNGYGYMFIFGINNGVGLSHSWLGLGRNNSTGKLHVTYGEIGYGYIDSTTTISLALNTSYKIGISVSSSGGIICVNGNTYTVSTSYNPGSIQRTLYIGGSWRQSTDGQRNIRGYIKNLKLYDKTLTSEELIQLTS